MQKLDGLSSGKAFFFNTCGREVFITMPSGVLGVFKGGFLKSYLNGDVCIEVGDATILIS